MAGEAVPIHVALVAHFWGQPTTGSGQYLHRLVEHFRVRYPHVQLTLLVDAVAARRAPRPPGTGWRVVTTPFDRQAPQLAKLWFEQVAAPRAAKAVKADLLHVPYFAPPLRSTLPVAVTIHDLIPMILPAYRGNRLVRAYTALAARAADHADLILTDSDASRHDILRLLQVEPGRVERVYLAVDEPYRPQPEEAITRIRERYGLPERFMLYLGGFDMRKNVSGLLHAAAHTQEPWPLVIAGRLPEQGSAFFPDPRHLTNELGVAERVRFLGWVPEEEKPALLAAAALFVFPSLYEGFGLPILEAMACGTATLTTNVSSLPELAGNAAALVPPDDVDALRREMSRLMGDSAARDALAERGLSRAASFSWARCVEETFRCYQKALTWW